MPSPSASLDEAAADFKRQISEPYFTLQIKRGIDVEHFQLRNLDTGEVRMIGQDNLLQSFLGDVSGPSMLLPSGGWVDWWVEKRQLDESLWEAAESGSAQVLNSVVNSSAGTREKGGPPLDLEARCLYGRTALHIAASVGEADCVKVLLEASASLDAQTDSGLTALHIACQRGHSEVARLLLEHRKCTKLCSVGDENGNLPLHIAAVSSHKEIVSMLITRGGDETLRARNALGQRPGEVACDIDVARIFQEHPSGRDCDDSYAGRKISLDGEVLLRTARADVVGRLLRSPKVRRQPRLPEGSTGGTPDDEADQQYESSIISRSPSASPLRRRSKDSDLGCGSESSSCRRVSLSATPKRFVILRPSGSGIEEVGPDSFEFVKLLGGGSFGKVYQVKHKQTEAEYAMKILGKSKVTRGSLLRYTVTERNVLSYIRHPYIVSLHYAFQTSKHLVLVLQYCPGGDLQKKLRELNRFEEPTARLYSAEVLTALAHLHERLIVYRDLKPENVVLDSDGHCLLTDFGLSKEGVAEVTQSFCGSLAFLAPEVLANRGHGHTVDIYGLGVLLFAMLTGRPPFYDRSRDRLISNIQAATLHVPPYVSQAATALIRATMKRDPNDRLGFRKTTDVQSHYFYASMDFDALLRREVPVPAQMPVPAPIRQQTDAPISPFEPSRDGRFWRGWRWCAYLRGDTPDRSTTAGSRNINGWDFSRVPGN